MTKTPTCGRDELPRALIFIPLGLGLLYLTLCLVVDRINFLAQAQRAEGHVSALNAGGSHPQIDFADAAGNAASYPSKAALYSVIR
ncbi:Uncharacterized protein ABJ99_2542 [Pseudomonas syringae pv. cilantro]|uniref:Uncharacterized protein n=1 Tax=Pseudomonas syringae pv. cilantro TaxID=81035 RepID=A0A0N0GCW8_PSESX|nr:Uncharacterized protein ABJ99_2542 [Pseudomonas syringae pv. cilantro]